MLTRLTALLAVLVVSVCACSSGGGSAASSGVKLAVTDAWVRASMGTGSSAAYLTISNTTGADDTLVGASTPAAASASLHETTSSGGMTGMQHTDEVKVPAGQTVKLEPGGYHIMLMDLTGDLAAGSTIELTLTFERAGVVKVTAEVRAS